MKNVIPTKKIVFYFQDTIIGNINDHYRELCIYCTINSFLFQSISIYKHFIGLYPSFFPNAVLANLITVNQNLASTVIFTSKIL